MIAGRGVLLHGDLVAGLGRLRRREDGSGRDIERQHAEEREHHRHQDFIQLIGIHRRAAPQVVIEETEGALVGPSKAAHR